jgi:1-aminocyclopropane-1-carboxylate deaminase/D-cysteine desulfhydrase-like pyridoxal-dependent ACC family enzyme
MQIDLKRGYRIRADKQNWILEKKNPEKKTYQSEGFYNNLTILLADIIGMEARLSDAKSFAELRKEIIEIKEELEKEIAPIIIEFHQERREV